VTIKNGGRMADWQLPQMEQSIRQSVEGIQSEIRSSHLEIMKPAAILPVKQPKVMKLVLR
jgi:hypothetical protein